MTLSELITKAAEKCGSHKALATELGVNQSRFSEWKKGMHRPDVSVIAFLARKAELPVLETVADIEAQIDERYSFIWAEALGKLKAAGVAATVAVMVMSAPDRANAAPSQSQSYGAVCILCQLMRRFFRAWRRRHVLKMARC